MSKTVTLPFIQFERGLEEIYNTSDKDISLPSAVSFSPAQIAFSDHIESMLAPPGIDDFLRGALLPEVDRGLLAPHTYGDTLVHIATLLRSGGGAAEVGPALAVIDADLSLRELLFHYRNALIAA